MHTTESKDTANRPVSKETLIAAVKTIEAQLKTLADFANFHTIQYDRTKCCAYSEARGILGATLSTMFDLKASLEMSILTYDTCVHLLCGNADRPTLKPSNDGITYSGPRYAGDTPYNHPTPTNTQFADHSTD